MIQNVIVSHKLETNHMKFISYFQTLLVLIFFLLTSQLHAMQLEPAECEAINQDQFLNTQQRCQHFQAARLAWIDSACHLTHEQNQEIQKFNGQFLQEIFSQLETKFQDKQRNQGWLVSYLVIPFAESPYGAAALQTPEYEAILAGLLTQPQHELLKQAETDRRKKIDSGFIHQLVNVLDAELFLSSSQRKAIHKELLNDNKHAHPMYSLDRDAVPPHRRVGHEFDETMTLLNSDQTARWSDLVLYMVDDRFFYTAISQQDTPENWRTHLEKQSVRQWQEYEHAIDARMSFFIDYFQLDAKESRKLELASTSIVQREKASWMESFEPYIDSNEKPVGAFVSVVKTPALSRVVNNPFWQELAKRYNFDEAISVRQKERHLATTQFVLSVLDQELWLTFEQRIQIEPIISATLSHTEVPVSRTCIYPEVLLIGRIMIQNSIDEIIPYLRQEQAEAYRQIKSLYKLTNGVTIMCDYPYSMKQQEIGYITEKARRELFPDLPKDQWEQ